MRAFEILTEGYRYVGNCTNNHVAPHLQDMMDTAKEITYRTFVKSVGLDNVQGIFADYSWGYQRGDLRMKNDPYVRYYRSSYNGKLCYYVRHSGIEYIFVEDKEHDNEDDNTGAAIPITANDFSITGDGAMSQGIGRAPTFWGKKTPTSLSFHTTTSPSPKAAATMMRVIRQSKLETIISDEEVEPAAEVMRWLKQFVA
jgi:hypothetical protein